MNLHAYGNAVAVSRDGSTVAVATDDARVLVVDAHTGRAERTIRPQAGPVSITTVAFFPDGTLASGSWAGIVNLWDPKTYADGTAYRWPVTVGAWQDQACRVAGRNFTREEWRRFVTRRSYERVCPGVPAQS